MRRGFTRRSIYRRPIMARRFYRPFFSPMRRPWGLRPLWLGGGALAFMLFGCLLLAALLILR